MSLSGKLALVTGSSGGIGRSIALALAAEGVRIGLVGRNAATLAETAESVRAATPEKEALPQTYVADLSHREEVEHLAQQVLSDMGDLDILVHSAGTVSVGRFEETSADVFEYMLRLNTLAPYILTQRFLPGVRRRRGDIIFINSHAGIRATSNFSGYSASKFALRALTDALREELREEDVRIINVMPGKIATPMQQFVHGRKQLDYNPESLPQAEDVAAVVLQAIRFSRTAEMTDVILADRRPVG